MVHEYSIAKRVVEIALEVAEENHLNAVELIHLRIGVLSCVQPDFLTSAYRTLVSETPLNSSQLHIESVPARAICRDCSCDYDFPMNCVMFCPRCGGANVEIYQGRELSVESISGQVNHGDQSCSEHS